MNTPRQTRENIMAALIMLMITALFISRAMLSICCVVFCITAVLFFRKEEKREAGALSFLFGFGLLFLLPFISGIWSSDAHEWWNRCVVKLPLLLLAFGFLFYRPGENAVFTINLLFILFVTCGSLYSIYEYVLGTEEIENGYLQAKVMPVITEGDHIRFSWLTVIAIILIFYVQKDILRRSFRIVSMILMAWLAVFLHLLAAKTGLLLFYSAIIILFIHYAISKKKKRWLFALLLLPLVPFLAYHTIPTFKNRVQYALYDYQHYRNDQYREGLSDGMRIVSMRSGIETWQDHFIAGAGFGDLEKETQNWYARYRPEVKPYEQILPSSQLLLYAAGTGIIGLFFFLAGICIPLTRKYLLRNVYFIAFYIPALLSFIFEIHLESQYGCFIFCFFALWMGLCATRVKTEYS